VTTDVAKGISRFWNRLKRREAVRDASGRVTAPPRTATAGGADTRRSIAVLPFANLSDSAESGYFSDGFTEEILNLLARRPDLRVVSRATSFTFRMTGADARAVASKLDVERVLEGSVRRAGDRVHVVAQLVDGATGTPLWSGSFDRAIEDIFPVQSEIVRCIFDAMELQRNSRGPTPAPTGTLEAYDCYLRGRQYYHQVKDEALTMARQLFTRAIEADPDYARAHLGLAETENLIAQRIDRSPEQLEAADRASRQALKMAPDLAEAHSARGFALSLKGDFGSASREFDHALELDPQNYDALYLYGRSRFTEGRLRDAAVLWARAHAVQLDEFQSMALRALALRHIDPDEARCATEVSVAAIRKRLELDPDDLRALSLGSGQLVGAGCPDEGIAMARRAVELAPDDVTVLYNATCCFALAGLGEEALTTLERRLQRAPFYREWLENDSDFDSVREDPRFQALLERMPRIGD
jgi:TolB-like protein